MDIKAILKKAAMGETLTEAEKAAVLAFDPDAASTAAAVEAATALKRVTDAEAKAARILAEKKEAAAKVAELEGKLESLSQADLNELQKLNAKTEATNARLETLTGELEKERTAHAATAREHLLDGIHSGIRFDTKLMPAASSRVLVSNALSSIDLTDEFAVKAAIDPFIEQSKGFILADSAGGAGTGAGDSTHQGGKTVVDGKALLEMATHGDVDEALKQIKAAADADQSGTLELV